jgi:dephospho-CoA kinase
MLVIGLTGGIGSGKTTVANLFAEMGIDVIDTDIIAREIVEPGQTTLTQIIEHFGDHILDKYGYLDRQKLAEITFNNNDERKFLEAILHPEIKKNMLAQIARAKSPYCIAVIPLLFETKQEGLVDKILVIDCEQSEQLNRVLTRDNRSKQQIQSIINSQIPRNIRVKSADYIIRNSGNMLTLRDKVLKLHKKYMKLGI